MRFIFRMDDGCGSYCLKTGFTVQCTVHCVHSTHFLRVAAEHFCLFKHGDRNSRRKRLQRTEYGRVPKQKKVKLPWIPGEGHLSLKKRFELFFCIPPPCFFAAWFVAILTFLALATLKMFLSFQFHLINNFKLINSENKIHPSNS